MNTEEFISNLCSIIASILGFPIFIIALILFCLDDKIMFYDDDAEDY